MNIRFAVVIAVVFSLSAVRSEGQESPCGAPMTNSPAAVSRTWWEAFALGDTEALVSLSAKNVSFVANNGRTFDRNQLLQQAATHTLKAEFDWKEQTVRLPAPAVAIVTSRVVERVGPKSATYRYLAVLQCANDQWQMLAAQSNRELEPTVRAEVGSVDAMKDLAGQYRTASGKSCRSCCATPR